MGNLLSGGIRKADDFGFGSHFSPPPPRGGWRDPEKHDRFSQD
jgi:hypothetical protein